MCLDTIAKTELDESGFGWKVFNIDCHGHIYGHIFDSYTRKLRNRWLVAKRQNLESDLGLSYTSGFHIFLEKEGAVLWLEGSIASANAEIMKVKYRKGHTTGRQQGIFLLHGDVIVADEMLILPKGAK